MSYLRLEAGVAAEHKKLDPHWGKKKKKRIFSAVSFFLEPSLRRKMRVGALA